MLLVTYEFTALPAGIAIAIALVLKFLAPLKELEKELTRLATHSTPFAMAATPSERRTEHTSGAIEDERRW